MITKNQVACDVERLLAFGVKNFALSAEDAEFAHNALLDLVRLSEPTKDEVDVADVYLLDTPHTLLAPILDYAEQEGIIESAERPLYDAKLMGAMLPKPSQVIGEYNRIKEEKGVQAAMDWFYKLCIDSNYIRIADVRRNLEWKAPAEKADLVITVNLSKPEKDNKEIARLKLLPQVAYPRCMLCFENLGYAGRLNFPARQTLRFLPLTLSEEEWYVQFSPYVYYNQHCIVFSKEHRAMTMNEKTFDRLTQFVTEFPHWFVGSNACLPIVGGSILTHEHYQGGGYEMPMHTCEVAEWFESGDSEVRLGRLNWYNSVVRLESTSRESLVAYAAKVNELWKGYSAPEVGVLAETDAPHNAVTPVARKKGEVYILDLVLRNNRTDETYPDGIFHAHPEHHNIKKEGIGLIEAMGLFILPGRLQRECAEIAEILMGKDADYSASVHKDMIDTLKKQGVAATREEADARIRAFINETCVDILRNTAVFKEDEAGLAAFRKFFQEIYKAVKA